VSRVVVTGAGRGIGRDIAVGLGARGWSVACLDKDPEGAKETAELAAAGGAHTVAVAVDLTDDVPVAEAFGEAADALGGLDGLVANAGGAAGERTPFLELTSADWTAMVDRNLLAAFHSGLHGGRILAARGGGSIVFTSSIAADIVMPELVHYGAAKGGVRQLMRGMAVELAPHGIRVNSVAPGSFLTPGNERLMRDTEAGRQWAARVPLGRLGRPGELVGAVDHLLGPEAAYTTGTTIVVDGGFSLA
jgi:NAD(P)-dependent dehydrogenase (short-subunit alcohol dehydrogenase family)